MLYVLAALLLLAQRSQSDLDPREYRSPSGEYVLRVDPSTRDGSGPGTYALSRGGKGLWSREHSFTLRDAVVADDGTSAGFGHPESGYEAEGELVVALLSPDGQVRFEDRARRVPGAEMHSAPQPHAVGVFLQQQLRRAVIRINTDGGSSGHEEWWSLPLDAPHRISKVYPHARSEDSETMGSAFFVGELPGTPLTLAHWYLWDWPRVGARFALHDAEYRAVWRLDLPSDYLPESEDDQDLLRAVRDEGAVLDVSERGFELRFFREGKRATFHIEADPRSELGWTVVESARVDFESPAPPAPAVIPDLELALVAKATLGGAVLAASNPVRDVVAFDVATDGRVHFVRRKKGEPVFTAATLAPSGALESESPLPALPSEVDENVHWLPLADGDWLLVGCTWSFQEVGHSLAWRWNSDSRELEPLVAFHSGSVEALAPLPGERFAVLATSRGSQHYNILSAHSADGRALWSVGTHDLRGKALFAPDDLAATGSGTLALVSSLRRTVELFDGDGAHLRSLELAKAWSQEPKYPVGLAQDSDDGLIVFDFGGDPPTWRMSLEGEVRGRFRPRFQDGNAPEGLARKLRRGRDGRLWTTDGSAFHRLDEEGLVDLSLGAPPDDERLEQPGTFAIDPFGRVLVQDKRTGAVHVFDAQGRRRMVCRPDPQDYERNPGSNRLQAASDGGVFVQRGGDYLDFGPDGARRGVRTFAARHPHLRPGSEESWSDGFQRGVRRFDANGEMQAEVTRHPNGNWLRSEAIDVLADGSVVVYDSARRGIPSLVVFDRSGREARTIVLPEAVRGYRMSAVEGWIVVSKHESLAFLVQVESGRVFRVAADTSSAPTGSWTPGFSADGSELWWISHDALELQRYALPID